jgi:hypothetical protein
LEHLENLTKAVDEGTPVDIVYLDLAKAFDTVPHKRLLTKLKVHGIDGAVLSWIGAWLSDRTQRVKTQGASSEWKQVTSSVVQGSVLGPLCFLIYMNDLEMDISSGSTVSKFADDTKLSHPVSTTHDIENMQQDINKLHSWSDKWKMKFNKDKCGVMHTGYQNPHHTYKMGDTDLNETVEEKDFGIMINKTLKVSSQCASAAKKANRALGMIKRNFTYRNRNVIISLYKSLVRPHLDYCMQVWSPYLAKDKQLLEKVQARATKLIPSLKELPYEDRIANLNLTTLEDRRRRGDLIEVYRIMNQIDQINPDTMFNKAEYTGTRGHSQKLAKSRSHLDIRKYFFSQRVINDWNRLPESAVSAKSTLSFKIELKKHMGL